MNRLTLKRTRKRNSIRYRLHTSIEATAYLADDPGQSVIDHELAQIMQAARPEAQLNIGLERAPSAWRWGSSHDRFKLIAVALIIVVIGAAVAVSIAAPAWLLRSGGSSFAFAISSFTTGGTTFAALLTELIVRRRRDKSLAQAGRRSGIWGSANSRWPRDGEHPEEVGRVTGFQQEQPSLPAKGPSPLLP